MCVEEKRGQVTTSPYEVCIEILTISTVTRRTVLARLVGLVLVVCVKTNTFVISYELKNTISSNSYFTTSTKVNSKHHTN